eukprot:scaffold9047_cov131-Cylindrotheca_fusiformis.AAC.4
MTIVEVYAPSGRLGVMLKDGVEVGSVIKVVNVLEGSQMFGKLFRGDIILGMGGKNVATIDDLLPLVQGLEDSKRYMKVDREFKPGIYSDDIQLDERTGIEKVRAPSGTLGLRLDKKHRVLEVFPDSPLFQKIYKNDQIVTLNGEDVTEVQSKNFVEMLVDLGDTERILGVRRAPHSPRQVPVPPVKRVGLVLRDNSDDGCVDCMSLLHDCPLKGKVFPGDRIRAANCRPIRTIKDLMPYMADEKFRVLTVETPDPKTLSSRASVATRNYNSISSGSRQEALRDGGESKREEVKATIQESAEIRQEDSVTTTYKTVGQEIFLSVIAPPGKLGIKLNKQNEIVDLLSSSPLAGKLQLNDRLVTIDEADVRGKDPASLIVLLMATQHRVRALGVRRKTGKQVRVAVCEPRKRTLAEISTVELQESFPTLSNFGVPMGKTADDMATRSRLLSELLSFNESIGFANDVETETGAFCHLVKIPKKGLGKRSELVNSLDDVISSLGSICGDESVAADLLLEFLARKRPSSFIKYNRIAESRPAKKRKIEESKIDPQISSIRKPSQNGDVTKSLTSIEAKPTLSVEPDTSLSDSAFQQDSLPKTPADTSEGKIQRGTTTTADSIANSANGKPPVDTDCSVAASVSDEVTEPQGGTQTYHESSVSAIQVQPQKNTSSNAPAAISESERKQPMELSATDQTVNFNGNSNCCFFPILRSLNLSRRSSKETERWERSNRRTGATANLPILHPPAAARNHTSEQRRGVTRTFSDIANDRCENVTA